MRAATLREFRCSRRPQNLFESIDFELRMLPLTHTETSQEWFFGEIGRWREVGSGREATPVRQTVGKAAHS